LGTDRRGIVNLTNVVHTWDMWQQVAQIVKHDGWTLVELSRRTGIDKGQLSRFLRGERELRREALDRLLGHLRLVVRVERGPDYKAPQKMERKGRQL
jgi:transcriptional regulator with XRE-family HTH domain